MIKQSSTLRHKVLRICAGDPLYALGHIERLAPGEHASMRTAAAMSTGTNGEKAQAEARAIAEKQVGEAKVPGSQETKTSDAKLSKGGGALIEFKLERPEDGRPMLVANSTEQEMSRRARGHSILGLALFVGGALYVASTIGSCMQR